MKLSRLHSIFGGLLLLLFTFSVDAASSTITGISDQIKNSSLAFYDNISAMAIHLLFMLFGIAFSVKAIMLVLKRAEFQELVVAMVKMILAVGVYLLFIKEGVWFLTSIIDSAKMMGATGAGISADKLNPGAIMYLGIDLQDSMVKNFNDRTGADSFMGAITNFFPAMMIMVACLIILFSFAMIALNLFLTYCEMYLLIAIAPFMFALGGMDWTKDNALKPWQSMIAVSVKIMVIALIAKIAIDSAPTWSEQLAQWQIDDWKPMWQVAFQILSIGVLALLAPKFATAAMSGGTSMSAADALQAGGNVGSMVTGAGAAALGVAAATGSGASKLMDALNAGGGAKAAGEGTRTMMDKMGGGATGGGGASGLVFTPSLPGAHSGGVAGDLAGRKYEGDDASSGQTSTSASDIGASPASADTSATASNAAPEATPAASKGDAKGALVSGQTPTAKPDAPASRKDLEAAIHHAMQQNKPGVVDKLAQLPDYVPNEGMVSGASVSHVNLD